MGTDVGDVTKDLHERAQLAYLVELILADASFTDIHRPLRKLSVSKEALHEDFGKLAAKLGAVAKRLNIEPLVLAWSLVQWSEEADLGNPGPQGGANWSLRSPELRESHRSALKNSTILADELRSSLEYGKLDPLDSVSQARKKAGALVKELDKLKKSLEGEMGRRKRLFYECSKRDMRIFFLVKIKKIPMVDVNILRELEGPGANLDLSIKSNRIALAKKIHGRANEIVRLMNSVHADLQNER